MSHIEEMDEGYDAMTYVMAVFWTLVFGTLFYFMRKEWKELQRAAGMKHLKAMTSIGEAEDTEIDAHSVDRRGAMKQRSVVAAHQ